MDDAAPAAHIRSDKSGEWEIHSLEKHLREVGRRAGDMAAYFSSSEWAQLAGLWHDLGKYRSGFQSYIRQAHDSDAHIEGRVGGRDKTHSAAGALWAQQYLPKHMGKHGDVIARVLSYLIAGHHAGLDNWDNGLKPRFSSEDTQREFSDSMNVQPPSEILQPDIQLPTLASLPVDGKNKNPPGTFALWVRMLFSCLVDADFLDTEAFMDKGKPVARQGFASIPELLQSFDAHMERVATTATDTPVNTLRENILYQCREKASLPSGVFTLTVPTGGGKTLSSLAFALRHAANDEHRKRRVIYAIPYTSIIEQTADIFRNIFGDENIVEHHSNAESDPKQETTRTRLACENWDAPLIVTTNVQLFESLFARRTSRCRKLHNIAGSVIVLDEAQLLPVDFLQPIVDVLRILVSDYGVTLLLCTATQPDLKHQVGFDPRRGLRGFAENEVTEIIDDVNSLYKRLERVKVFLPDNLNVKRDWPDIAHDIGQHDAVLAIVNRRKDARELYRLLKTDKMNGVWHLSALMCPQHRSDAIKKIKNALHEYRNSIVYGDTPTPVRVVSTQLVEAGVDIDFPVVFRAMAGLDSVAQAAGRCNREGTLDMGKVYVFVPPSEPPLGLLRQARDTCKTIWHGFEGDPLRLDLFPTYFQRLYADGNLDKRGICEMLRVGKEADVRFKDAAEAFRLIDNEDGATVIVRYPIDDPDQVDQWVAMLERDGAQRWLMRKLQRFGITIYQYDIAGLLARGEIREVRGCEGLYVQVTDSFYSPITGANVDGAPGDPCQWVFS